jgi:hypothetical protein
MRRPGRLPSTTWTASRLPARTWLSRYSSPGSWAISATNRASIIVRSRAPTAAASPRLPPAPPRSPTPTDPTSRPPPFSRNAERRDGRNAATRRPSSRHASLVATSPSAAGSSTSRGRSVHAAGMNVPAPSRTRSTTRHGNNASSSRATPRRATPPARRSTAPSQAADRQRAVRMDPAGPEQGAGGSWLGRVVL